MIPAWVARYIGLPFALGGRGPDAYDCWGLVRLVLAEQFGVQVPAYDRYQPDAGVTELAHYMAGLLWPPALAISREQGRPGDVALIPMAGALCHVGVMVAPDTLLHTHAGADSGLARLDRQPWRARMSRGALYRHQDLA